LLTRLGQAEGDDKRAQGSESTSDERIEGDVEYTDSERKESIESRLGDPETSEVEPLKPNELEEEEDDIIVKKAGV